MEEPALWVLVQVGRSRYRVARRDRVVGDAWCYRAVTDNLPLADARSQLQRLRAEDGPGEPDPQTTKEGP